LVWLIPAKDISFPRQQPEVCARGNGGYNNKEAKSLLPG
jgi:hypothetical protein